MWTTKSSKKWQKMESASPKIRQRIRPLSKLRVRRFSGLFWPIFDSFLRGNTNTSYITPQIRKTWAISIPVPHHINFHTLGPRESCLKSTIGKWASMRQYNPLFDRRFSAAFTQKLSQKLAIIEATKTLRADLEKKQKKRADFYQLFF